MHVIFDARPLQSASVSRGIGRYTFELLASLAQRAPEIEFTFVRMPGQPAPHLPRGVRAGWLTYPVPVPERLRGYADALVLPSLLASVQADLYHSPEYGLPIRSSLPAVVSVHDLVPWMVPHWTYLRQRVRLALQFSLLSRARLLMCDSEFTRRSLVKRRGIASIRTRVVYPGISSTFFGACDPDDLRSVRARLGDSFALMVGECDWRKRPEHAIAAIGSMPSPAMRLVIVGPNRRHAARIRRLARAAGVLDRVIVAGTLSDNHLLAAYLGARLLLFPSSYEGFGMPVLEAAAAGLPVVAYANSALPEVCGDAIELVLDGDLGAFTERAQAVASDPNSNWDAEAARARAQEFSWARAADEVMDLYQEIRG